MNLFLKDPSKGLVLCKHVPFQTEEDLELLVFNNSEILGDIFPVWRQVRGGAKPGIPDIIGIDREGTVCIIEIKNVPVDQTILPQVLEYAIWAEDHPDSIAKMWLEKDERPDGLSPDFKNYAVRIVVVAPTISPGTVHHMRKVAFKVDLVEVNRYYLEDQLVVSAMRSRRLRLRVRGPTVGAGTYDRQWYEREGYDRTATMEYVRLIEEATNIVKSRGWPLEVKLNKNYVSFKTRGYITFGIEWASSKEFSVFFKLPESEFEGLAPAGAGRFKYDAGFKQGAYRLGNGKAGLEDFIPLMEASVRRFVPT